MAADIRNDVERWYDYVDKGQFDYAWDYLSERKREQITSNANGNFPNGKASWRVGMRNVRRDLKFRDSRISVSLKNPSYPDQGVKTIKLSGMVYNNCGHPTGGITWVSYDDVNDRWLYEPGVDLTEERIGDWGGRSDLVTHKSDCS